MAATEKNSPDLLKQIVFRYNDHKSLSPISWRIKKNWKPAFKVKVSPDIRLDLVTLLCRK